ncbi:hypothetical protein [Kitasatospora terrestris]|uniref:Uncharacterized protein n=1 Tax=Kitasatospora terrestris TaxID=258051 RepID=A0ABP9EU64_9ACTN
MDLQFVDAGGGVAAGVARGRDQDPAGIGVQGVDQALAAIGRKPVTARIGTTMVAITKANIDDPAVAKYVYRAAC